MFINLFLKLSFIEKNIYICALVFEQCIGTWTSGAIIPRKFSSVPEHSITNEKLIVHGRTCIFVYCLDEDVWERFDVYEKLHKSSYFPHDMPLLTLKTMSCYIGKYNLCTI